MPLCTIHYRIPSLISFTFFFASFSYFYEYALCLLSLETDFTVKTANKIMLCCEDEEILSRFPTLLKHIADLALE